MDTNLCRSFFSRVISLHSWMSSILHGHDETKETHISASWAAFQLTFYFKLWSEEGNHDSTVRENEIQTKTARSWSFGPFHRGHNTIFSEREKSLWWVLIAFAGPSYLWIITDKELGWKTLWSEISSRDPSITATRSFLETHTYRWAIQSVRFKNYTLINVSKARASSPPCPVYLSCKDAPRRRVGVEMAVRSWIQMICFTYPSGRKHTLRFFSSSSSSSLLHLLQSLILPLYPFGLCLLLLTRHSSHSPRCLSSIAGYLLEEHMNKYPCIRLLRGSKGKAIEILMGASLGRDGEKWGERIEGSGVFWCQAVQLNGKKRG